MPKPYNNHIIGNKYYCKYHKRYRVHITDKLTKIDKCMNYARYLMEIHLGKVLESKYDVHHKDGNALNDELSNLEIVYYLEHSKYHRIQKKARQTIYPRVLEVICLQCNKIFKINHRQQATILKDQRKNPNGNSGKFCSKSCSTTYRNLNKRDKQFAS